MTTERTYRCNVCRDRIEEKTGIGIQFLDSKKLEVKMPLINAENHLCRSCVENITRIGQAMTEKASG